MSGAKPDPPNRGNSDTLIAVAETTVRKTRTMLRGVGVTLEGIRGLPPSGTAVPSVGHAFRTDPATTGDIEAGDACASGLENVAHPSTSLAGDDGVDHGNVAGSDYAPMRSDRDSRHSSQIVNRGHAALIVSRPAFSAIRGP